MASGGQISESIDSKIGTYTCKIVVNASPSGSYNESFTFSLTMNLPTASDQPTGLTASSITSTSVALSWLAPGNNGGSEIINYEIWWDQNDDNWQLNQVCTDTSKTVTGLIAGNIYRFKVKAINSIGASNFTDIVSITTAT